MVRVPISEEKRLAIAMALHPALAPDSQLFQIASIPVNALKAGKRPECLARGAVLYPCSIPPHLPRIMRVPVSCHPWGAAILFRKKGMIIE